MKRGSASGSAPPAAPLPPPPSPPPLDYAQLFSFQIAYRDGGAKGGEWEKAIMEVNFSMRSFIMLDKERVIVARPFDSYTRCAYSRDVDDPSVSLFFGLLEWELNVQNSAEKECVIHLLQCITKNMTAVEAVRHGIGRVGLDRKILKYGIILRKAKAKRKRTERFLVIVPGKLFMFAGTNILGRHVRSVTSLFRASVKVSVSQLEFQIVAHHSKEKEMSSWMAALETSIQSADHVSRASRMRFEAGTSKTASEEDHEQTRRPPRSSRHSDHVTGTSNDAQKPCSEEARVSVPSVDFRCRGLQRESAYGEGHRRVSLSRQRLKAAIADMSDMIGQLNVRRVQEFHHQPERYIRDEHEHCQRFQHHQQGLQHHEHRLREQTDSSSENFYTNAVRRAAEEYKPRRLPNSTYKHRRRRRKEAERYYRDRVKDFGEQNTNLEDHHGSRKTVEEAFRDSWRHHQRLSPGMELPERMRNLAPFISRGMY